PTVGPGRSGALAFANLAGKYAASINGVAVLGESPLTEAAPVEGGLHVRCAGLLQASSQSGRVSVNVEGGGRLPEIESAKFNEWVLFGKEDGICTRPSAENPASAITYIRSSRAVTVKTKEAE